MTILSCDMEKFPSCPSQTQGYEKSTNAENTIHHLKNRTMSMTVGETLINLQTRERDFTIHYKNYTEWDGVTIILDPSDGVTLQCNGSVNTIFTADVSEYYKCIDSTLYFLDTRYNNAVVKEIDQTLTFSKGPTSDFCNFKETWSIVPLHKLKITNAQIVETTTWYIINRGVKEILKTTALTTPVSIPILIVPQPPSKAIPQDPEVVAQGFYDYFGDEGPDLLMAEQDGGQDFYFPEWCRRIGTSNQMLDIQEAYDRFSVKVLHNTPEVNQTMSVPPIATDGNFMGSMCVDPYGNLFYSIEIEGEIYNHLSGVEDITQLIQIEGAKPKYYPVGLV